jgi:hypothetical protein
MGAASREGCAFNSTGLPECCLSKSFGCIEDASDIIRAEGALIRQSSALKDSVENLSRVGGPRSVCFSVFGRFLR